MNAPTSDARYTELLHAAGLKSTVPRIRVLKIFATAKSPLRIKDIFLKLQAKDAGSDMVTIYRTIEILCTNNIVRRVDFHEDSAHYELTSAKHGAHFITCTNCHKRVDIGFCFFTKLEKNLRKKIPLFATITRHSVDFFGLCKKCAAKKKK